MKKSVYSNLKWETFETEETKNVQKKSEALALLNTIARILTIVFIIKLTP